MGAAVVVELLPCLLVTHHHPSLPCAGHWHGPGQSSPPVLPT